MPYSVDSITLKVEDKKNGKAYSHFKLPLNNSSGANASTSTCLSSGNAGARHEQRAFGICDGAVRPRRRQLLEVTPYKRNRGRTLTFYVTLQDLKLAKKD